MFLPSDMFLVWIMLLSLCWNVHVIARIATLVVTRFHTMFHYDFKLFKERFLGPDGVSGVAIHILFSSGQTNGNHLCKEKYLEHHALRHYRLFGNDIDSLIGFAITQSFLNRPPDCKNISMSGMFLGQNLWILFTILRHEE